MALDDTVRSHTDDIVRRVHRRASEHRAAKPDNWRGVMDAALDVAHEVGKAILRAGYDRRGSVDTRAEPLVDALLDGAARLVELAAHATEQRGTMTFAAVEEPVVNFDIPLTDEERIVGRQLGLTDREMYEGRRYRDGETFGG